MDYNVLRPLLYIYRRDYICLLFGRARVVYNAPRSARNQNEIIVRSAVLCSILYSMARKGGGREILRTLYYDAKPPAGSRPRTVTLQIYIHIAQLYRTSWKERERENATVVIIGGSGGVGYIVMVSVVRRRRRSRRRHQQTRIIAAEGQVFSRKKFLMGVLCVG